MDLRLTNKLALVSGSTKGIGVAIAQMLAREGARVIVNGRSEASVAVARKQILDAVPNAMVWADGRLLMHDAKGRRLLTYAIAEGKLTRVGAQPDPEAGVIGLAASGAPSERASHRAHAGCSASGSAPPS